MTCLLTRVLLVAASMFADVSFAGNRPEPFASSMRVIVRTAPESVNPLDTRGMFDLTWGPLLGAGIAAADNARARQAMDEVAPVLAGSDPLAWFYDAAPEGLDRSLWARELRFERSDFGGAANLTNDNMPPIRERTLILWPNVMPSHDFSRFFVGIAALVLDPDQKPTKATFSAGVSYVVEFPIQRSDARVENARRIAALGRDEVQSALRAAVPELFAMLNYESGRRGAKEKLGAHRQQEAEIGKYAARVVAVHGDREWLRWRVMFTRGGLISAPARTP